MIYNSPAALFAAPIKIDPNAVNIPVNPVTDTTLEVALNTAFVVIGSMSVLFLIIGAIRYQTSNGDQSQITRAKDTILYAIVGIVITMMAFGIVRLVLGVF